MQRCPTRLIWSCFCSNRWFYSHVRMSLVISNSECIWASLASQSCVKYKVNIVRRSDKKSNYKVIFLLLHSSSSQDPKDILTPAFIPSSSSPSPQHPMKMVSSDGGDRQPPRYLTEDALLEALSPNPCPHILGDGSALAWLSLGCRGI